jgi:SAM-dependent methyltransferase
VRRETYRVEREVSERHWWFRGRRRILGRLLADLDLPPDARILDAGCGTGANTAALAVHGRVYGVDASPVPLARRADGRAALARLEALPFAAGTFDLVAALDLLEHLDDDAAGARELGRVLAPTGRLVVFVPAFEQLWGLQDDVSHHCRRYTARGLRGLLERAGLRVRRLSYFNTALFFPIAAARLAMRIARPAVATENDLTTPTLNGLFGAIFGAEAELLARWNLPFGVSMLALAAPSIDRRAPPVV